MTIHSFNEPAAELDRLLRNACEDQQLARTLLIGLCAEALMAEDPTLRDRLQEAMRAYLTRRRSPALFDLPALLEDGTGPDTPSADALDQETPHGNP